tara:strand:+ start:5855 stop:6499 length:645 start_codon:yes stop_codon:yes gene_type:complete
VLEISKVPIVLHTMDSYSKFWNNWFLLFKKFCINHGPIFFLSEEKEPDFVSDVTHIKTGKGEWGERLIYGLSKIESDLIIYMQEDFWCINELILNDTYIKLFTDLNMSQLHIKGLPIEVKRNLSLTNIEDNLYKFNQDSKYTQNHQFGLWRKDKLLDNVLPNENPWGNEINGTKRLNKKPHNIYIINHEWYTTVSRRGQLMERGKEIIKKYNLK